MILVRLFLLFKLIVMIVFWLIITLFRLVMTLFWYSFLETVSHTTMTEVRQVFTSVHGSSIRLLICVINRRFYGSGVSLINRLSCVVSISVLIRLLIRIFDSWSLIPWSSVAFTSAITFCNVCVLGLYICRDFFDFRNILIYNLSSWRCFFFNYNFFNYCLIFPVYLGF